MTQLAASLPYQKHWQPRYRLTFTQTTLCIFTVSSPVRTVKQGSCRGFDPNVWIKRNSYEVGLSTPPRLRVDSQIHAELCGADEAAQGHWWAALFTSILKTRIGRWLALEHFENLQIEAISKIMRWKRRVGLHQRRWDFPRHRAQMPR